MTVAEAATMHQKKKVRMFILVVFCSTRTKYKIMRKKGSALTKKNRADTKKERLDGRTYETHISLIPATRRAIPQKASLAVWGRLRKTPKRVPRRQDPHWRKCLPPARFADAICLGVEIGCVAAEERPNQRPNKDESNRARPVHQRQVFQVGTRNRAYTKPFPPNKKFIPKTTLGHLPQYSGPWNLFVCLFSIFE